MLLWSLVGVGALAAAAAPLTRWIGVRAGYVLAAGVAAAAGAVATLAPGVVAGEAASFETPWIPALEVSFALRLDALSLLFALLVLVIGAIVLAYCPRYLTEGTGRAERFYALLTAFAAAMYALVIADDVWLLYVAWEGTTVTSFLLIAHGGSEAQRDAGVRAFVVTFAGGLCLLGGLLLAATSAGSFRLSELVGGGALAADGAVAAAFLALGVAAAVTKSAQWPLHSWLSDAMVAPTPVSAYLHSAAMVKAGIYLLARMSPLIEAQPWTDLIVVLGLVTAVFGSAVALRRTDLKEILAYSTVGQLGLIVALLGVGSFAAIAAALLHVVAHATYKAPLFLVAGAVDHAAGDRDIHDLSGLRRPMPVLTGVAALAVASMAGLPPLLGYVSKEEALAAFIEELHGGVGVLAIVLAIAAVTLTVAYALRLFVAVFLGAGSRDGRPGSPLIAAPAVLAVGSAVGGVWSAWLSDPIAAATGAALGHGGALALGLWHGPTWAFSSSVTATVLGVAVVALVMRHEPSREAPPLPGIARTDAALHRVRRLGGVAARALARPVPGAQLGTVATALIAVSAAAWVTRMGTSEAPAWPHRVEEWAIVVILGLAVTATLRARNRLALVAALGIVDFLVIALYVTYAAPDLVMTQLVVDALTVGLIVIVFRQLPSRYPPTSARRRALAGVVATAAGVGAAIAAYALPSGERSAVAAFYLETAPEEGGKNVVNTILTDFRAFDTLGEITVVAVAAIGVVTLLRATGRSRR